MNKKQVYGLLGYRLSHSFSRKFFNEKFANENIDAEYRNFEIDSIDDFRRIIDETPDLRGMNVTIPYKQSVIAYLDGLDDTARAIGAVNVIKFIRQEEGLQLIGYNSDVIGFIESIRPLITPTHRKALVLGTGGASKAVRYGLSTLGVDPQQVSRTPEGDTIGYADLTPEILDSHKIVVNATPLGMYPKTDACPDIPYEYITPGHLAYDLVYNPETTLFMEKCAAQGATTKNGLEMLRGQALAAWEIWNK